MSSDTFEKPDPPKFTFKDIQLATNDFAAENLIAETSTSKVYEVQRLQSEEDEKVELINVLVHVLKYVLTAETVFRLPEACFPLLSVNNNIISVVGYCGKLDEEVTVIVMQNEANGSLDKHLSSKTLTWIQRLRICLGIARAIHYFHYGFREGMSVIHGNIKSSRILLDDNWEPKLFGFEFSVVCKPSHPLVRIIKYGGSLEYMDPAFEKTGGINQKSDVFSLGVVLFEVLFGQRARIQNDNRWYFADLARRHYEETRLDELIDPDLRQQMDSQSLHIFSETVYRCLKEQREQRLDTSRLVKKLEKALEHQLRHENPVSISIF
uniref:probable serine/threonine-protein kinase PBL28 n=1 Tax=Erigeron canadensis TaxID=72917 RepID=UPI001CB9D483|nr:probable serine/threonine-protein kinase PBL28 [Erigeron canadensis]